MSETPNLPPVVPCCSSTNQCAWADTEGEPCYGQVSVIEEVYSGDDYSWVHGCEGHENMMDRGGKYKPYQPASQVTNSTADTPAAPPKP